VDQLPSLRVPDFASFVKASSYNFVTKGIVKGNSINHVLVALKSKQLLTRVGVPNLASAVVTAGDETVPTFVEGAVGEG
jgi:hypothetical protein